MAFSPPPFEPIVIDSELEPIELRQLGLGNAQTVGTSQGRFIVTTTVRDVRYGVFKDGRDPSKQHEACIVVLHFEFGAQQHRISSVNIKVLVYKADAEETDEARDGDEHKRDLLIAGRYPLSARGAVTEIPVTRGVSAKIEPSIGGISVGNVAVSKETTFQSVGRTELTSRADGEMALVWKLEEDRNLKRGVPDTLACAVLLQTDSLPFELRVEFKAPLFGRWYMARPKMVIKKNHLWRRMGRDAWEAGLEWRDFDSEEFRVWVMNKTGNVWAEGTDYGNSS
jgi:hypothetical protein